MGVDPFGLDGEWDALDTSILLWSTALGTGTGFIGGGGGGAALAFVTGGAGAPAIPIGAVYGAAGGAYVGGVVGSSLVAARHGWLPSCANSSSNNADYTPQSRGHVFSHGHAANSPRLPGKSRFRPTEGGAKFVREVMNHPNVQRVVQGNGRINYSVTDLGRTVGRNKLGNLTRGGTVIVEGYNPSPWSTYCPGEVVTMYPQ